jgi:membrane associated rhomboid family serine protease
MLPLSDGMPARRFPIVNVAIIVANFAVWLFYELPHLQSAVFHASFYPCTVTHACHGPEPWGVSWITAMFMHGSWDHILGNMLFLVVFGKNVEDAFGHLRYLAFYFACGFVAMMTQTLMTLAFSNAADGRVPNLGASGAIAAVLGAYFVLYPNSTVFGLFVTLPSADLGVVLPRLLVPLPALRGELRALRCNGQRRRRRVLRPRRRLHLRRRRRGVPQQPRARRAAGRKTGATTRFDLSG